MPSPAAPLRVAHVYNWLDPRNGGPPQMVVALARAQRDLGVQVTLVSSDAPGAEPTETFLRERLGDVPPRVTIGARVVPTPRDVRAMDAQVRASDLVHVHGLWPQPGLLAGRVCRWRRVPYVLSAHGMLHPEALAQHRLRKLVGLYALGYRRLLRGAAAVHFLNPVERERASLPLPARTAVIPNGVFPEEFADDRLPAPGSSRASITGLGEAQFVLYLARLHRQKGPDLLAEAFAEVAQTLPDVHLVVAGPDEGARTDFEQRITGHGLSDRVHVVGPVYGKQKLALLRDAAVFCLPSRQEGFSVGITEALACGTPCVVTETCNFPEVGTRDAGVVTRLDAGDLARGLVRVLRDPAEARARGARGRALVLSRYTWPRVAAAMCALYEEVVGR